MRIALGSAFRNSAKRGQLPRYFAQVVALRDALAEDGHTLRLIAVEGDSDDSTPRDLFKLAERYVLSIEVVTRNHGCPWFGSTEEPLRMEKLSWVGNGILETVRDHDEVLIYVESDLLWTPETMLRLIKQLQPGIDVIAPMPFAGAAFYDIWAFRKNGHRFGPFAPYHGELKQDELTVVDSVGSCLVMRAEVARQCRIIENYALVGFCKDVWRKGFTVWCDARERVQHP
jgi:hypothetical protein